MSIDGFCQNVLRELRQYKELADKAIEQISDEDFFRLLDEQSNSVALIVKHMAGNMRSRWRDFLTSDGEKPDRHRDNEFIIDGDDTKESLMQRWEENWRLAFETIEALKPEDLIRTVYIRTEPYTVLQAINRQLTHYSYHVGQIVFLAKHLTGENWTSLSIPKGKSEEFNAFKIGKAQKN